MGVVKLQYNILCIDDNLSTLLRVKEDFEDFNEEVGIDVSFHDVDAKIKATESQEEFRSRITQSIEESFAGEDNVFDFILVDLHLGPVSPEDFNGSDVIKLIRDSHSIYRPIVFYSAGSPASSDTATLQLEEATKASGISGRSVFIVARDELSSFLSGIANEMHSEEHKINHVRGLLMDQVSELDARIINAIGQKKIWENVQEGKRNKVTKEFKRRVSQRHKSTAAIFEETKDMEYDEIQEYILKNPRDVDTFSKAKILREMLKYIDNLKKHGEILSEGINGDNSIIAIRNSYGHSLADKLKEDHDSVKCKLIRNETRRQVANITLISEYK